MVAHGVHLALVAAGLAGLGALLAPTLAHRWRADGPRDAHDRRVVALRAALGEYAAGAPVSVLATAPGRPAATAGRSTLLMPLAVTSAIGAAGVHAAMAPPHLREGLAFGTFFLVCAAAQLAWAESALRRPTVPLLLAGAAGNLAVLALWVTTRAVGLPLGLMPAPEAVGTWDVTAAVLETVVVVTCLVAAGSPLRRTAAWTDWHPAAHAWFALGTTFLVVLSLGGL